MNYKSIYAAIFLTVMIFSFWGCANHDSDPIVVKLANGQELSLDEKKLYNSSNEAKAQYDKWVVELKKDIVAKTYYYATANEIAAGKRIYHDKKGNQAEYNISPEACMKFGFLVDDLVDSNSNYGQGYVVGVRDGNLWFQSADDKGASHWSDYKKKDYEEKGFKLVKRRSNSSSSATPIQSSPESQTIASKKSESSDDISAVDTQKGNKEFNAYFTPIKPIPFMVKR